LVIPILNEEQSLTELITSINNQTFPPDEIIIVDGGSTDASCEVARRLTAGDLRYRILRTEHATPGKGRNIGIRDARNEWIALTDAGLSLERTWLQHLVSTACGNPAVAIVYGNYEPVVSNFFQGCGVLLYCHPKSFKGGGWMRGPSIASSLLKRSAWQVVGGFPDLRASEDEIFMERIRQKGLKIGWCPQATVWWQPPPTVKDTFRRFATFSRWNVWAGRKRFWHSGFLRFYLCAIACVMFGIIFGRGWFLAPVFGFIARVVKRTLQQRDNRGFLWAFNPLRIAGAAAVLAVIDLATFVGWIQALFHPSPVVGSA
jgi:glycosyltransferase involved in cell wall biosynthesis